MVLNFDFEKMSKEIFWSQYILAVILKSFKIWHGALHGGHASLWRTALRKANFIDFSAIKKFYFCWWINLIVKHLESYTLSTC